MGYNVDVFTRLLCV